MALTISACHDEENNVVGFVKEYKYEMEDTIVSADSHEISLSNLTSIRHQKLPKDWVVTEVRVWHGTELTYDHDHINLKWQQVDIDIPGTERHPMNNFHKNGNSFGTQWIEFEKQLTATTPKLKIKIKENDTNYFRAIKIGFGDIPKGTVWPHGEIIVIQKPKPDTTPFTMNIRYKGQMYSTTAQLNLNEEVEYSNPEFGRVMDEIDGLKDVEAMVLEDNIVDYFDLSDSKTRAAVTKISGKVDAATRCNLRTSFPLTRAADAFRFDSPSSLGYFAMFDDSGFSDTNVYACLNSLFDVADQKYMRDINLNDKVSSLAVAYKGTNPEVCAVLTIWEDSDYNHGDDDRTQHRISIIATKDNPRVSVETLKSIKCINSRNTWNDRISSYSFAFGNYDSHLKNY